MAPELTAPLKSANGSRASRRGKTKTFPKKERQGRACSASRWSAIGGRERAEERFYLTRSGPLMEAATAGSVVNNYIGQHTKILGQEAQLFVKSLLHWRGCVGDRVGCPIRQDDGHLLSFV